MTFRDSWTGYAAALWAMAFAVLHVGWATGWYVGLDRELARQAFQRRWFLVYDLVVAGSCAVAVCVALALTRPWGRRVPRSLLAALAWCGTTVLILRGGAGVLHTAYGAMTGRNILSVHRVWEAWFCLGALLFGVSTWRFWLASRGIGSV